jgi:hypothetical protein
MEDSMRGKAEDRKLLNDLAIKVKRHPEAAVLTLVAIDADDGENDVEVVQYGLSYCVTDIMVMALTMLHEANTSAERQLADAAPEIRTLMLADKAKIERAIAALAMIGGPANTTQGNA